MSIEKYKVHTCPATPEASIVQGDKYRISVLTSSLIRLEYAEDGVFEDRATQSVWFRDFPTPAFRVEEKEEELSIFTENLQLIYNKGPFTANGLSISLKGITVGNYNTWHYGEEPMDLGGTARTLDNADGVNVLDMATFFGGTNPMNKQFVGRVPMEHGIVSNMGFSWFDDSKSMVLEDNGWIGQRMPGKVDLYFFGYGHRYLEALKDFYHLCGKTPLLPRYAFGNWWSRYHRYTEEEYKTLITRFENERIPFSVSVVDMDWHLVDDVDTKYGSGWTGYTWNPKFFPDPKRFMSWLHDHNMRITLNVHPADGIRAFEKLYPQVAEAMGVDPASELPIECDLANPKFVETYFDKLHHPLEEEGVDFWWIDWQQGGVTKTVGLDPLWVLNHYHFQDSTWKGNRALTFSRYAGVGSHRYPVGFSGDTTITWDSLAFQPYFTSTASNIGYGWWSHDIGGHMLGIKDDELTTRWVQFGVFSPIMRLHSSNNPFAGKEPWNYGFEACHVMEDYLRLRHELVPYLYSMNHRAHYEDQPLVWPMYYAEPENRAVYSQPDEYYFGSELIVSAITKPADRAAKAAEAKTWIPEGQWVDFFNGTVYEGGRMMSLWRSLDSYPVLMKAGGIVPMKDLSAFDNSTDNPAAMNVKVFPAAAGSFTLWEDAGDTAEPKAEDWAATLLSVDPAKGTFTIAAASGNLSVLPAQRSWKLQLMAVKPEMAQGLKVTADGTEIPFETSYDARTGSLTVAIPAAAITAEIRICCAGAMEIRPNPVVDKCFEVLQRAEIGYEEKRPVYMTICGGPKHLEQQLAAMNLPESVFGALLEIVSAC